MKTIGSRKDDHIRICTDMVTRPEYCYWDDVRLIHEAIPEVDADDIDMRTDVFGKTLEFPMIVTAITGGFPGAKKINSNIAEACAELGIGMGVGSQRAAIEKADIESYSVIKDFDVPLVIGNVGAPQLIEQKGKTRFTPEMVGEAMDLIDANLMAVHLNYLQEAAQPEGDTRSKGCLEAIRSLAREYPLILKETGAGMSADTVQRVEGIGIKGIDIAGMGGTSFSAVEMYRSLDAGDDIRSAVGLTFIDWGIPTPASLAVVSKKLPIIASGGVRNGKHVACAIAMGACCAGVANLVLKEATESAEAVKKKLMIVREELRTAMLLTGSSDIESLSAVGHFVTGETAEWIEGMN